MATPEAFTYPLETTPLPDNASKVVLITGINGYIASHVAFLLLQKGYTVRGTSRRSSTLTQLLTQPAFAPYKDTGRLQHTVVEDITRPGAFDEAIRDVHAVMHTASPVDFTLRSTDDFFHPAKGGVLSLLISTHAESERSLRPIHFVQMSSISAVVDKWRFPPVSEGGHENRAYTETDWNVSGETVARASETSGTGFLAMVAYGASKAAAEKCMWEWIEAHPESRVRCSVICPGVVTGPCVNWPQEPEQLNETLMPVWKIWSGASKRENQMPPLIGGNSYIDVRDVAALHAWVVEQPEQSAGQRYLATNGKAPPQAIADLLRDDDGLFPGVAGQTVRDRIITGSPGKGYIKGFGWSDYEPSVKSTKAYRAMGIDSFRGFEDSIRDTVEAFRLQWPERGL